MFAIDFLRFLKDTKGEQAVRDLLKLEKEYLIKKEKYAGDKNLQYNIRQLNIDSFKKYFKPKKKKSAKNRIDLY